MLARPYRLTAKRDFDRVSRSGRPVSTPCLTIRWIVRQPSVVRVGIVTGLKVSKRATVRNLVKRRLRAVFQRHLPSLRPDVDLVVHTRSSSIGRSYRELADEVGTALARARVLRAPWVDILGEHPRAPTGARVQTLMPVRPSTLR